MNKPLTQDKRSALITDGEQQWPRDFDFREAYAEQRELLEAPADRAVNSTTSTSTESHA
jgi:hypothetical protein